MKPLNKDICNLIISRNVLHQEVSALYMLSNKIEVDTHMFDMGMVNGIRAESQRGQVITKQQWRFGEKYMKICKYLMNPNYFC